MPSIKIPLKNGAKLILQKKSPLIKKDEFREKVKKIPTTKKTALKSKVA